MPRLLKHPQVLDRMRYVGVVRRVEALALGFVGPTARARGVERKLRQDDALYPAFVPVVRQGGDVAAYGTGGPAVGGWRLTLNFSHGVAPHPWTRSASP